MNQNSNPKFYSPNPMNITPDDIPPDHNPIIKRTNHRHSVLLQTISWLRTP